MSGVGGGGEATHVISKLIHNWNRDSILTMAVHDPSSKVAVQDVVHHRDNMDTKVPVDQVRGIQQYRTGECMACGFKANFSNIRACVISHDVPLVVFRALARGVPVHKDHLTRQGLGRIPRGPSDYVSREHMPWDSCVDTADGDATLWP